jgi:phosphoglycolate phosphatase-like HAD superfamily hydrolase
LEYYAGNKLGKNIKKPSKVAIDCSLRVLNSSGSKTLYFGDTIDDLRACNDVGLGHRKESLITVGVSWGYLGRERLEAGYKDKENKENYDFDYIIDKPKEILDIFHEVSNNF